jgi:hypothetical protein
MLSQTRPYRNGEAGHEILVFCNIRNVKYQENAKYVIPSHKIGFSGKWFPAVWQ